MPKIVNKCIFLPHFCNKRTPKQVFLFPRIHSISKTKNGVPKSPPKNLYQSWFFPFLI